MAIQLKFPDGAVREYAEGTTLEEVAASISSGLKKNAVAGKKLTEKNGRSGRSAGERRRYRDRNIGRAGRTGSVPPQYSHLMAQALKRIYGSENVKLGIGPVIEDGFYYDIDMEHSLTPEDLTKIEKEMERIAGENLPITRMEVSRAQANRIFLKRSTIPTNWS